MRRFFTPLLGTSMVLFAAAPIYIASAPYESTMGLVQKIFYFHVPSWWVMFTGAFTCGIASAVYLFRRRPGADYVANAAAELAVLFGLMGLVTGPLWARKAWGVWWQWDARLTISLLVWMIFIAYLLLRKYGGPGSEIPSSALAVFGMAAVPFVYQSVNVWRTVHPTTNVVPTLVPGMRGPYWFCVLAFMVLYCALLTARVRLEEQRATLEQLFLNADEEA